MYEFAICMSRLAGAEEELALVGRVWRMALRVTKVKDSQMAARAGPWEQRVGRRGEMLAEGYYLGMCGDESVC